MRSSHNQLRNFKMSNHLSHPITGFIASVYSGVSVYLENYKIVAGFISLNCALFIAIFSLISAYRKFKRGE